MHGPAPAPAVPGFLAEQLRHGKVRPGALCKAVPVSPVGRGDIVRRPQGKARAHAAGLLSHIQMDIARQLAAGKAVGGLRFKGPNQRHPPIGLAIPVRSANRFLCFQGTASFLFRAEHRIQNFLFVNPAE
ncbi:hypothetical protein SDC9_134328 [bioreactor metagenome]|uniref:Uncharacterized protein n=1 Tax=bioreactor metagenome TaxID=1076179 RepID=A0A645DEF8_9ZZZZ